MRFLRRAYLYLVGPGEVPTREQFDKVFKRIQMDDTKFNTDNYNPGTGGDVALYNSLKNKCDI